MCHVFCECTLVVQFFLNSVMEKIPEYVNGNILPAENLNLLEITSFVAPPIASNPPRLSKGWSWTWWTQVRTQTGPKCLGPGPAGEQTGPCVQTQSGPGPDLFVRYYMRVNLYIYFYINNIHNKKKLCKRNFI